MVVPLVKGDLSPGPLRDLHPVVMVGGVAHVMMTHALAAVPIKALGPKIGSLAEWHDEITRALDILLVGL
jgi:toxin CcdB